MKVHVESVFDSPAEKVWVQLLTSASFEYIIKPLVYAKPCSPKSFPAQWQQGQTLVIRPYLFCFIPMSLKTIKMESINNQSMELQTREYDAMVKVWDHKVTVKSMASNKTKYSDIIEIKAGMLTPAVWLFARWFYRHRQNRWRKLLSVSEGR